MLAGVMAVHDVDASVAFYIEKLGFTSDGKLAGPDGKAIFGNARMGEHAHFMFNGYHDPILNTGKRGLGVEFHITLPDEINLDALYARFQQNAVTIAAPMKEEYWGERRFTITDPDGYFISFVKQVKQVSMEEMESHTKQGE